MEEPKYLKHLSGAIPEEAYGYHVGAYSIALEAWRRGLKVTFINKYRQKEILSYKISDGNKEHEFLSARGDLVSREAINICKDKDITKSILIDNNVPTPEGKAFEESTDIESYVAYAKEIDFPLVVKPIDGTGGKGVFTGIESEEELKEVISYLKNNMGCKEIIIEKYIQGNDYRLYVINNKVVGAYTRERANVIGDGINSIRKLVKLKNKKRAKNPGLKGKSSIKLNHEAKKMLQRKNYNFDSIPEKNEKIYLNSKNNVSSGGDPTDKTDLLSDYIKQIAIDALNAIPGLVQGGIDLIINEEKGTAHVLEINSLPSIRAHIFPMKGQAKDIPKEIIDFYFPKTKEIAVQNSLFFDFDLLYQSLNKGYIKEYKLPDYPQGEVVLTRFEIINLSAKRKFANWCVQTARTLRINGYLKEISQTKDTLVLCGNAKKVEKFKVRLASKLNKTGKDVQLVKRDRKSPVKVGFEVIGMNNIENYHRSKNTNYFAEGEGYFPVLLDLNNKAKKITSPSKGRNKKKKNERNNKNIDIDYKREYEKVINSTSWKLTKPFRNIRKLVKQKK
uniref:ATP-grasp domain-containing protein n=1 Tax=uncultured Allobacillus sp. TaxID=1638025 RepID=UPI002591647B|nr:ATP-grasp domain-containing protein [uncultured Allobacillus sp.]